eukprot:5966416-Pyramimonas_sp.AAC.1
MPSLTTYYQLYGLAYCFPVLADPTSCSILSVLGESFGTSNSLRVVGHGAHETALRQRKHTNTYHAGSNHLTTSSVAARLVSHTHASAITSDDWRTMTSPGVEGQKGLRLQFNSRQLSTVDT